MERNPRYRIKWIALCVLALTAAVASLCVGRYPVGVSDACKILTDALLRGISAGKWSVEMTWSAQQAVTVLNIRLPRIAAAFLIGAALSCAGAAYQGMFRNPMVSPDLLGASTGAGFGAALGILLGGTFWAISGLSFVSGLLAVMISALVNKASHSRGTVSLVLAGMVVSSLFSAATSLLKLLADTKEQLPAITYWLMGSLSSVKGRDVLLLLGPTVLPMAVLLLLRWRINLLTLSEAEGRSMGVDTRRLRAAAVVCATLMTAAGVAVSGMIGWVGLVVPHIVRMLFGHDYRRLLPASCVLGGTFLLLTDDLARTLAASEIPLGVLTAFVGAPVFLYLLMTGGKQDA